MRNSSALRQLLRMHTATLANDNGEPEPLPVTIDPAAPANEIVEAFVGESEWWYARPLLKAPPPRQTGAGKAILALPAETQLAVLFEALQRAAATPMSTTMARPYALVDLGGMLLAQDLGYSEFDLRELLALVVQLSGGLRLGAPLFQAMLPHLEQQVAVGGLSQETRDLIRREIALIGDFATGPEKRAMESRVTELLAPGHSGLPHPDEPWAAAMLESLRAADPRAFAAWQRLLAHVMRAEQSKPPAKWSKQAEALVEAIGFDRFKASLLQWFEKLEAPAAEPLSQHNCQIVKGLAWACGPYEDAELSRALGRLAEAMLFWIPQFPAMDWRGLRAGNACLYALSVMPGDAPVAELTRLSTKLKGKQLQDSVNKAIATAGERRGMSRADLEELTVPEIEAPDSSATKQEKSRSKAAERQGAAQRVRLERLLVGDRSWTLADWRQRYERQPLLAPLVSRLIWRFQNHGASELGMPQGDDVFGVSGSVLALDADATRVSVWHPMESDGNTVQAWRRFLEDRRIVQPFKQAHREVYVPTGADLADSGSDRFAGHLIRQDRFKALCDERDWRYSLQGWFMHGNGIAVRTLAEQDLRAELEVRPSVVEEQGAGRAGFFPVLTTGPLRFLTSVGSPCPPGIVTPAAFSELMRDVDLFVGVCGIGVDPSWNLPASYAALWREEALAELSEAATSRRATLEEILPRMSFASRCRIEGRFLTVQGDLRSYRVHIGSGNVLMSPNDQFLYIPPPRRATRSAEEIVLPFEGDTLLGQILSRAAVLAADSRISDRALRSQIAGG
jgi:Domain of unknown function (DUF4132)